MANGTTLGINDSYLQASIAGNFRNYCAVGNSSVTGVLDGALRFANVATGSTVNYAAVLYDYVETSNNGSGNWKHILYGMDEDNTADFSSYPMGRTKTSASVTTDDGGGGPQDGGSKTFNVTSIFNEIVSRGGWSSGNAMGFFWFDNGSSSDVFAYADGNSGSGDTCLVYRVSALPDFTPGPYSRSSKNLPSPEDYGMAVSKRNNEATGTPKKILQFTSAADIVKAIRDGELGWTNGSNLETVNHQLGYVPAFLIYFEDGGKTHIAPRGFTGGTGEAGGVVCAANDQEVQVSLDPNRADPDGWYYYIFVDENL